MSARSTHEIIHKHNQNLHCKPVPYCSVCELKLSQHATHWRGRCNTACWRRTVKSAITWVWTLPFRKIEVLKNFPCRSEFTSDHSSREHDRRWRRWRRWWRCLRPIWMSATTWVTVADFNDPDFSCHWSNVENRFTRSVTRTLWHSNFVLVRFLTPFPQVSFVPFDSPSTGVQRTLKILFLANCQKMNPPFCIVQHVVQHMTAAQGAVCTLQYAARLGHFR